MIRRRAVQRFFLFLTGALVAPLAAELEQAPGGPQAKAVQRLIELGRDSILAVRTATNEMLAAEARSLPHS